MTLTVPEFWTRSGFRRAHRIDVYGKAEIVQRDLRSGSWTIDGIPADSDAAADLEAGGGIIVYYRGEVLDSGRVEVVDENEAWDDGAGQYVVTKAASGSLDLAFVEDRLAHPDPVGLTFTLTDTKLYNAVAETALKAVVNDNLGSSAHVSRRLADFVTAADQARGSAIYDEVRMDPLGVLLAGWGVVGGIIPTCKVINGQLVFDVYEASDRSDEIVFAVSRGTAISVRRVHRAPETNFVWVGGQGEGTARTFLDGGDPASEAAWGFRRELLRDRRDTNDLTVLAQQLEEELAIKAGNLAVTAEPLEGEHREYLTDYVLGDLVTAVSGSGVVVQQQIREMRIRCTPEEVVTFQPTLADPLTPTPMEMVMFTRFRDLASRVVEQESR